jgi:hypothetical protein
MPSHLQGVFGQVAGKKETKCFQIIVEKIKQWLGPGLGLDLQAYRGEYEIEYLIYH